MRYGQRGPTNGGPAGYGAGQFGPAGASPEDAARRVGKVAGPAVDPTQWAESRRQKVERAERLRAENRRRLQAIGQLPLDGSGPADVAGPLSGVAQQAPQLGSWPPPPGVSPPQQKASCRSPAWPEAGAPVARFPAPGVPSGGYARQPPPWAEMQDNAPTTTCAPAVAMPSAARQPPPWAEMEDERTLGPSAQWQDEQTLGPPSQPQDECTLGPPPQQQDERTLGPRQQWEDERTLGPPPQQEDEHTLSPPLQRQPPQKPVRSVAGEVESLPARSKAHTQEDLAELLQQAVAVGAYEEGAAELRTYIDGSGCDASPLASPAAALQGPVDEATLIPQSLPPEPAEMTLQPAAKPAPVPMGRGTPLPASLLDGFGSPPNIGSPAPNLGSPGPNLRVLKPIGPAADSGNAGVNSHETTAASRIELTAVLDRAFQNHAGDTQMVAVSPLVSPIHAANPGVADERTLDLRQVGHERGPTTDEHTLNPGQQLCAPKVLPRPPVQNAVAQDPGALPTPAVVDVLTEPPSKPLASPSAEPMQRDLDRDPTGAGSPTRAKPRANQQGQASDIPDMSDCPTLLPSQAQPPSVQQASPASHGNAGGFCVETYVLPVSDEAGSAHAEDRNAWWAKGPGPSWLEQHDSPTGNPSIAKPSPEPANVTMWPARDAKRQEQPTLEAALPEVAEASPEGLDPWALHLRGSPTDEYCSEDPMVFGKPRPRQSSQKRSKPRSVPAPEARSNRTDTSLSEAQSEEANAWIGGLRGSPDDEESVEDPLVFGKPRERPQPRRRTQQRPPVPRPTSLTSEPDASVANGSSSSGAAAAGASQSSGERSRGGGASGGLMGGSRPSSSGYFSKRTPSVGQQMPEGLRKRLEQRDHGEQRGAPRLRDRRNNSKDHQLGGDHSPHSPTGVAKPGRSESRGSLQEQARSAAAAAALAAAAADDDRGSNASGAERVRLPPIGSDGRGRRCASQPPIEPTGPARQKKQPRPQSMGAGKDARVEKDEDEKCGRQMFDKNTLRTRERDLFRPAIHQYRLDKCTDDWVGGEVPFEELAASSMVRVFVRKRPLFEKEEKKNGDYDVATILPGHPVPTQVVLHNCLFQADLKTPYIQHLTFEFDHVWDQFAENDDVYWNAAAPLVRSSLDGGVSTMFMFGQTGSGKTFTMSAIQKLAAQDLYEGADGEEPWLSVTFVELRGNRCFDLLAPSIGGKKGDTRPELRLREHGDGGYAADGAADLFPKTSEELCAVMEMAQSRRATSATDANAVSSRSHAVCILRLVQSQGQLMLVDCAGTERRKDSMFHSKERQVEGAEINASLHALKECIRYLTTTHRVPSHAYRASSLTKILADAFMRGSAARLAVICTASPCATDTEHTLATLRMGMALGGRGAEREERQLLLEALQAKKPPRLPHPKQWTPEQVCEWLGALDGGRFQDVLDALPSNFTGQMLVRMSESRCVQLCGSERRGRQLFDLLHQEIDRAAQSRRASQ